MEKNEVKSREYGLYRFRCPLSPFYFTNDGMFFGGPHKKAYRAFPMQSDIVSRLLSLFFFSFRTLACPLSTAYQMLARCKAHLVSSSGHMISLELGSTELGRLEFQNAGLENDKRISRRHFKFDFSSNGLLTLTVVCKLLDEGFTCLGRSKPS